MLLIDISLRSHNFCTHIGEFLVTSLAYDLIILTKDTRFLNGFYFVAIVTRKKKSRAKTRRCARTQALRGLTKTR